MKKQLPAAVHIVIDKCGVVTVDGSRRIVEGGQQVGADVPHLRRILMQAADYILDVAGVQLQQSAFHNLLWVILASNADHFSGTTYRVYQNVQNFIQQVAVIAQVFSGECHTRCSPSKSPDRPVSYPSYQPP